MNLPPGFQFMPTDEELILHYLYPKAAALLPCTQPHIIPDLQLLLYNPWEFNGKALFSGNVYYFFNKVTEISNKATESGYWKDLNNEESIFSRDGKKVGIKNLFHFYIGKSPKGTKTCWILQQYTLSNYLLTSMNQKLDCGSWVLCRVHECKADYSEDDNNMGVELSCMDEMFLSFDDDFEDITFPN